ncbi:MAG TPA: hypothetical protein VFC19_46365 [Candidatus Limnocylindrales bacterium]|nr:hypothetical protein [Candidatus Limnocylindrales bacterium]
MSVPDNGRPRFNLQARFAEVVNQASKDEALLRQLHDLAVKAGTSGGRGDFEALFAQFARSPEEMAMMLPEAGEDGVVRMSGTWGTTGTLTTTTTITSVPCLGTLTTTTTTGTTGTSTWCPHAEVLPDEPIL